MENKPEEALTPGQRIAHMSNVLLPSRQFKQYIDEMANILDESILYIDSAHTLKGKESVLRMLERYVPRVANDRYQFDLLVDTETHLIWRWCIALKIRFLPFNFLIHGLVHAELREGKIVYQREYFDPMESIGMIPLVGWFYKLILKMA